MRRKNQRREVVILHQTKVTDIHFNFLTHHDEFPTEVKKVKIYSDAYLLKIRTFKITSLSIYRYLQI